MANYFKYIYHKMALFVKGQGENRKATVKGNKKVVKIVCHGDSVTAATNSYVANLKVNIEATAPLKATVINAGTSGQSMPYFFANLQAQVLQHNPDVVTLCVLLNELGNTTVGTIINNYINQVRNHVNPNGKSPILLLMTDNYCGQNIGQPYERTTAQQDAAYTRIMAAYAPFANLADVAICDHYLVFKALGEDTPALYNTLDAPRVHPNETGYRMMVKNMQQSLLKIGTQFYNN